MLREPTGLLEEKLGRRVNHENWKRARKQKAFFSPFY